MRTVLIASYMTLSARQAAGATPRVGAARPPSGSGDFGAINGATNREVIRHGVDARPH